MSKKSKQPEVPDKEWAIKATWEVTHTYDFTVLAPTQEAAEQEATAMIEDEVVDPKDTEPHGDVQVSKVQEVKPKVSEVTLTLSRKLSAPELEQAHREIAKLLKKMKLSDSLTASQKIIDALEVT